MTRVAVTGASGFIGRHLLRELQARGVPAIAAGRNADGGIQADLRSPPPDLHEQLGRPDVLVHLAWGGLPNYQSMHHVEDEVPAHYAFIRSLVAAGLRRVVVAGTCYEYGMQYGPLHEALEARPVTAYGAGKDILRRMLEQLARTSGLELTWARLFYPWGEGQAPNALYPQLKAAVERGDREFAMSGGEQMRDYLPVADVARCIAGLAQPGRACGIVNVCSGRPVSVRSLVEGWIRDNGWSIQPVFGRMPYPAHEPMAFWGDDTKLRKVLDQGP